jgi:hypothetical protein
VRAAAVITLVLCAAISAITVILLRNAGAHVGGSGTAAGTGSAAATAAPRSVRTPLEIGVVTYDLTNFEKTSRVFPSIDVKYVQWGSPFPSTDVLQDHGLGLTTMIVLEPSHISAAGIVAGRDNAYLASWADADRKLGLPIILSFAPEANGSWYAWGAGHIKPDLFREMWRRVHDEVISDGGRNITWLWQINSVWPGSEPLTLLWPGGAYVNEVGIDGQLHTAKDSFDSVFGTSIAEVRSITSEPVMISEVAVSQNPARPTQITGLFRGAREDHLAALVLFDVHAEWQIDTYPSALAAFRAAAEADR